MTRKAVVLFSQINGVFVRQMNGQLARRVKQLLTMSADMCDQLLVDDIVVIFEIKYSAK